MSMSTLTQAYAYAHVYVYTSDGRECFEDALEPLWADELAYT